MDFHPLDDATRERFDRDGYLVVRGALTPGEAAELERAADRLLASDQRIDRTPMSDAYDGYRNVVAHGGEPFERLLTNGRTVSLAAQLLSRNLQLHTSQLIYKRPEAAGA